MTRSRGPSLPRSYPDSTVLCPRPTPVRSAAENDVEAATSDRTGLPRLPASPFRRAVPTTPADRTGARVDCFPVHAAFPVLQAGRHPHLYFRGLLRLHSRYGPSDSDQRLLICSSSSPAAKNQHCAKGSWRRSPTGMPGNDGAIEPPDLGRMIEQIRFAVISLAFSGTLSCAIVRRALVA